MTRNFGVGEFYHVYNRGTDKRDIFLDSPDYDRFLALLYFANCENHVDLKLQGRTLYSSDVLRGGNELVDVAAYCLMTNHFHLLLHEKTENGISRFMQKLSTGYVMYFNTRYERSGALFEGKFKCRHVDTDRYLSYLISYIHLNPIKIIDPEWKENGIKDFDQAERYLHGYRYSSFLDLTGTLRKENMILSDILPETSPIYFDQSVKEWLAYTRSDLV